MREYKENKDVADRPSRNVTTHKDIKLHIYLAYKEVASCKLEQTSNASTSKAYKHRLTVQQQTAASTVELLRSLWLSLVVYGWISTTRLPYSIITI
uniref:HTH_48 domain-containing protein n=1 Tax=Ascaris lumbricoides TaxID=6252 RepID=A0A0M3HIH9_ASCLU